MQNIKKICFILVISIISLIDIYAQENNSYELLWQIDSETQSAPSYLFGTMHVKDKRAFNFSDAVMPSIEKCEIFALEVEPDSLVGAMFGAMFKTDTTDYLKELLSSDEYERFKTRFEERTGYEYDNLDSKNPMILSTLIQPDFSKSDDKQAFVDAYLFGIAKTMNKKTTGLEDIRTQMDMFNLASEKEQREMAMELLEYDTEDYEGMYNQMAEVYSTGNIKEMEEFLGEHGKDSILIARNHVMANSMERLMKENTTFGAVGTAHLWGEEGVIELLRKKGYTVSPVPATFTGVADKYKIDVSKMKWATYRDEDYGFTIEMPGNPFPVDMKEQESTGMKMQMLMYPDISTETNFAVMTMDFRVLGITDDEQLMDLMITGMKNAELKDFKKKKMKRKDREGYEIFLKETSGKASTIEMFVKGGIIYAIFVEGKRQELKQPYIKRFFNSYKSIEPKPIEQKTSDEWFINNSPFGAFSVAVPGYLEYQKYEEKNEEGIEPYVRHIFATVDTKKMIGYFVVYSDYPLQYYLEDRKNVFDLLIEEYNMEGSDVKVLTEPEAISTNGVEGIKCYATNKGLYAELHMYVRGNRIYRIFKQHLLSDEKELPDDKFFDSLEFTEYGEPKFEDFAPEGRNFTLKRFSRFHVDIDTIESNTSFISDDVTLYTTNPHSGGVYVFENAKIKDKYRLKHLDTFYNWYIGALESRQDSTISDTPIEVEGKTGREIFKVDKRTGALNRYRIWIDNDEMFTMSAYSEKEELFNQTSEAFFNSFKKTGENSPFDIYASKTKEILDGLKSSDTLVYQKSLGAFNYYEFIEEDLPMLYEAMYLDYPDDTLREGAKAQIIENIAYVDDASSIDELKKLYPQVDDIHKNTIIGSLVDFSDEDKVRDAVIELVLNDPPEELRYDWATFSYFSDSLNLGAEYFPQLLNLLEKEDYRDNILELADELIQSDTTPYVRLVENSFDELTKYALDDFEKYKKENQTEENPFFYDPTMWEYFPLMEHVKGKKVTDQYTNLVLNTQSTNDYQKARASTIRIINGFKTNKKLLKSQVKSIDTRYTMMQAYDQAGRFDEIPKKYRTTEEIARLELRDYVSDDWGTPDGMEVLGTIPTGSSKLYVFKLTYEYGDEINYYLGLTGPFSTSGEWDFDTLKSYATWEEEAAADWQKAAKEMLEDFEKEGY